MAPQAALRSTRVVTTPHLWPIAPELWAKPPELWAKAPELWTKSPELWTKPPELWTKPPELWNMAPELWPGARHLSRLLKRGGPFSGRIRRSTNAHECSELRASFVLLSVISWIGS